MKRSTRLMLGLQVATLLLAAVAYWLGVKANHSRQEAAFERVVTRASGQVTGRFSSYEYGVRGARGAVLAAGGEAISLSRFREYGASRDIVREFPGARGFGFIRRVRSGDVARFTEQARIEGTPDFKLRDLGRHTGDHYVIQYIEPRSSNEAAVGLDIASESNRREAADRAMRSGEATITEPVTLVQAQAKPTRGFLLLLPVYRAGAPTGTEAERTKALIGWSYAPIVIDEVLATLYDENADFRLSLTDTGSDDVLKAFYASPGFPGREFPTRRARLPVFGRTWDMRINATDAFVARLDLMPPRVPALLTTAVGLLLSFVAYAWSRKTETQLRARLVRARLAAIIDGSVDAVIGVDLSGRIGSWNPAASRLFGRTESDALDRPVEQVLVPVGESSLDTGDFAAVLRGEAVPARELVLRGHAGEEQTLVLGLSPIRDDETSCSGFAMTLRDVSRQRDVEHTLKEISVLTSSVIGEAFLQQSVEALGRLLRADRVLISRRLPDSPGSEEVLVAWSASSSNLPRGSQRPDAEATFFAEALAANRPEAFDSGGVMILADAANTLLPMARDHGYRAFLGMAMADVDGGALGRLSIYHRLPMGAHERERQAEVVRLFGQRIEIEFRRVLAEEERDRFDQELRRLNQFLNLRVEERTVQLRQSSALQRAIVQGAGVAIITGDAAGLITGFNPAAEALTGRSAESMVGKRTPAILHDPEEVIGRAEELSAELGRDFPPGFDVFVHGASDGKTTTREWTYLHADGERIPVLLTIAALRGEDGEDFGYQGVAMDLRESRRAEAALLENEKKLRHLFELSPLGIALARMDGTFAEINDAFDRITGYEAAELLRLDNWALTPAEYAAQEKEQLDLLQKTGRYGPYEKEYLRADGQRVPVRLNGVLIELGGQNFIWSIVEDITGQRRQSEALQAAVHAAQAANYAKSEFLANMSHEIRTPMNAILGMMQLLERTPLNASQAHFVRKSEGAAQSLLSIINDLLDYSKAEAGKLALDPRPFDLDGLFDDVGIVLAALPALSGVELLFDVDPGLPRRCVGDALRIKQILLNLASNAVKFTEHGEIIVSAWAIPGREGMVRISVRDSGMGIAPENFERIFDEFAQAEASTTRRFGGTGLGLAICRRLAALMDSRIELSSELGKGSTFWFDLSLPAADGGAIVDGSDRKLDLRVLVVDDNPVARTMLKAQCEYLGCRVDVATSGEAALALTQSRAFDVALVDWRMPGMDGLATIRALRDPARLHRLPLAVLITASSRQTVQEQTDVMDAPVDAYLFKPMTLGAIREALTFDPRAAVHASQEGADAGARALPVVESRHLLAGVRILLVEDNLLNQELARELLASEGASVRICGDGLDAIEFLRLERGWPHVVLMDIRMPRCDGFEATGEIRGALGLPQLPIIAMTANASADDRRQCMDAGMNDFVGKPFALAELCAAIRAQVGGSSPRALAIRPLEPNREALPEFEYEMALARFSGKHAVHARSLRGFLDEAPRLLGLMRRSPASPVEDWLRAAHTLKGLAGTVGASGLARCAAAVERQTVNATQDRDRCSLDELAGKVESALRWAERLLEQATKTIPDAASGTVGIAERRTLLDRMLPLLRSSNLAAVACLESLEATFGADRPQAMVDLRRAVDHFDFEQAGVHCMALYEQLPDATADDPSTV